MTRSIIEKNEVVYKSGKRCASPTKEALISEDLSVLTIKLKDQSSYNKVSKSLENLELVLIAEPCPEEDSIEIARLPAENSIQFKGSLINAARYLKKCHFISVDTRNAIIDIITRPESEQQLILPFFSAIRGFFSRAEETGYQKIPSTTTALPKLHN